MATLRNIAHTLPDVSAVEVIILPPTAANQANYLPNTLSVEETIQQTIIGAAFTRTSNDSASQPQTIISPKPTTIMVVLIMLILITIQSPSILLIQTHSLGPISRWHRVKILIPIQMSILLCPIF
jgi:hypothetical protein